MRNVQKHSPVTSNMAPTSTLSSNFDVEDQPQANLSSSQYSVPNTNGSITSSALAAAAASSGHNTVKSLSSTSAATTHAHSSQSNTSSSLEQTLCIKERLKALKDDDMHKNTPSSPSDDLARKFGSQGVGRNDRRNKGAPSLAPQVSSYRVLSRGRHGPVIIRGQIMEDVGVIADVETLTCLMTVTKQMIPTLTPQWLWWWLQYSYDTESDSSRIIDQTVTQIIMMAGQ